MAHRQEHSEALLFGPIRPAANEQLEQAEVAGQEGLAEERWEDALALASRQPHARSSCCASAQRSSCTPAGTAASVATASF